MPPGAEDHADFVGAALRITYYVLRVTHASLCRYLSDPLRLSTPWFDQAHHKWFDQAHHKWFDQAHHETSHHLRRSWRGWSATRRSIT